MIDLNSLVSPIEKILGKFVADKDLKTKLEYELKSEIHKANMAQLEVIKAEAAHKSIFVAGWRPFIGWVCGLGMAINFLVIPIANPFLVGAGQEAIIPLELEVMMPVLMGMLGLGAMRSYEKKSGVAREK